MIKIKVPATSANLGPGFDTLGIAFNLYNTFYVKKSENLILENIEEKYNNKDNLFVKAYNKVTQAKEIKSYNIHVKFETNIPISRGLGSSSSLIVGGVLAANHLHNLKLSPQELLNICNELEGHPDNIAPCLLGGFVSSVVENNFVYSKKINVHKKFKFTLMIPNFEVNTSDARKVMPEKIDVNDAVYSLSRAVSLCFSLQDGDENILKISTQDKIHEPYRKDLIPDYQKLKYLCLKNGALSFMISGSGSTCLVISLEDNFSKKLDTTSLKNTWQLIDCDIHRESAFVENLQFLLL